MLRASSLLTSYCTACAIISALALPAGADDVSPGSPDAVVESRDPDQRWGVSLGLLGGVTTQYHRSFANSECARGGLADIPAGLAGCGFVVAQRDSTPRGPGPLRPAVSGTDTGVSPFVGTNFELMTPTIELIPGDPRVFVSGEVTFSFASRRNIAIEGDPTGVELPETSVELRFVNSLQLKGVGTRVSSEVDTFGYGAAIGVAVPFEFAGRKLWLKPSVVWTRYEIDADAIVLAGLKDDPVPTAGGAIQGAQLREVIITGRDTLVLDGVGPGLELALEAGHYGPIGVSVFGNFNAYRILGNRALDFGDSFSAPALPVDPSGTGSPLGLPEDDYLANFNFSVNPWLLRAAVGVRFEWLGR